MEYMKFIYILVFTLLKKKYRRSGNLFRYRGQIPDTRTTKICSSEISQKQSTAMAPEQATICLDKSSHASKAARLAPLTVTVPKKPSKSEAVMSDQTALAKHPRRG